MTVLTEDQADAEYPDPSPWGDVVRPTALVERGRPRRIEQVQDSWRIDDEWWRGPISRCYYQLVLDDGSLRTVYQDLVDGRWYGQGY